MNKSIYLLLKQHNITKKFYLCKRVTNNLKSIYTYKGSGKKWLRHLKKHGSAVTTIILLITNDILEFKRIANVYNVFWNVGTNSNFLNLKPEQGDGGNTWFNCKNKENRKKILSNKLKEFNRTDHGKEIRKRIGNATAELQRGKTMKQRLCNDYYVDSRKNKSWDEIYEHNYTHPQQRPFKITCNNKEWIFKNEREFEETLALRADPTLRKLKLNKQHTIKTVRKASKHNFEQNSVLFFEWM